MTDRNTDISALAEALEALNRTTQAWEEAYRGLQQRLQQLDLELAEKNRALQLTTEYLGSLFESVSDGVVAVDTDGVITRFNQAAGHILGYAATEVQGRPFEEVFDRAFQAPALPGDMRLRAKSGREVQVNERDSAVYDHTGRKWGRVKTFQDLSELTALREQMRQRDRLAAIGEMAATVAHEIRNPLGGIRGFASFLAQDIPGTDPKRRLVDKILAGAASLDKIVTELLEYTRPVELRLRPASCAEITASALSFLQYDADRITLVNRVPAGLNVLADPDMMRQVLLNVLINAVQSIAAQGRIEITAEHDGSQVRISVCDTGCGMSPEQLDKLCSPFFTTKEKGTGLGMAVCHKIVQGHGGALRADSAPGAGTTIRICLSEAE